MTLQWLWSFLLFRVFVVCAAALWLGYILSLDWFARLAWFVVRTFTRALMRAIWWARRGGYRRRRVPLRSTKRDAKRAAHAYAKELTGRDISWKKARQLLARLEREGREKQVRIPVAREVA